MKKLLLTTVAFAALASSASAADLAARPYAKAPPTIAAAYNWSGFYVGAMGGYGWSDRVTILGVATTGADIKGGFGGGTVGFNYQAPGSMFVFGVEVDAAWSDINHTETIVGLGVAKDKVLHTAESMFHDHKPASEQKLKSCWIYRRHAQEGFGATMHPGELPHVDFQFRSMHELVKAHQEQLRK